MLVLQVQGVVTQALPFRISREPSVCPVMLNPVHSLIGLGHDGQKTPQRHIWRPGLLIQGRLSMGQGGYAISAR